MIKIELTNGETHQIEHDQLPEFFEKHQGEIVEYRKKVQPRRRDQKAKATKIK